MVDVYTICGQQNSMDDNFLADEAGDDRLLVLETTTFLELKNMLFEDYEFEERYMKIDCSYVLGDFTNMLESPPINICSDRQVRNFVVYVTKKPSTQLWVTFKPRVDHGINNEPRSCIGGSRQKESKGETFKRKGLLKSRMELCAMKHNFDYHVFKSTAKWWNIRCKDRLYNRRLWSISVGASKVFRITKLIMPTYRSPLTDKLSPNELIEYMEWERGSEDHLFSSIRCLGIHNNVVRGIPEKSYLKIPKYLYMLQEANPSTQYAFETDKNGRFLYLFMVFGQSIRGFQTFMRKDVIVDGTFLKNKYKGTLLVATCVDANNNLYPIAFVLIDSENDLFWGWIMKQLNVFIPDEEGLSFVSDINVSIVKFVETVFTRANHGIFIYLLLNNVVSNYQDKDMVDLVNKASKCYREVDFEKKFATICDVS